MKIFSARLCNVFLLRSTKFVTKFSPIRKQLVRLTYNLHQMNHQMEAGHLVDDGMRVSLE